MRKTQPLNNYKQKKNRTNMQISYRVEHKPDTKDYIGYCPVMEPVSVYGNSEQEVEMKMKEAISLYLEKHPETLDKIRTNTIEM